MFNTETIRASSCKPNLTRTTFREVLQIQLNLSLKDSKALLESILKNLTDLITSYDHVKIASFGTFLIHTKKERMGRNPKTKDPAPITARKSVSFRPSLCLRSAVNSKAAHAYSKAAYSH